MFAGGYGWRVKLFFSQRRKAAKIEDCYVYNMCSLSEPS